MPANPRSPNRKKQRIDELAVRAGSTTTGTAVIEDLTVSGAGNVDEAAGVSLIASAWRRLRGNPVFLVGLGITILFVLLALVSPFIAPHDPAAHPLLNQVRQQTNPIPGAQPGYPLGGDNVGRDLFSRLLVGSQQT